MYAATRGTRRRGAASRRRSAGFAIYALLPDLEARAVADRVIDGVTTVDYGGFVDLVAEHNATASPGSDDPVPTFQRPFRRSACPPSK